MSDRTFIGTTHPDFLTHALRLTPQVDAAAAAAGIDQQVIELVYNRVSQINGCAACLNAHLKAGRKAGLTEQRLALLPAWRDSELYDERDRAALELAEAVTLVAQGHMGDDAYDRAVDVLGEEGASVVQWAAISMNTTNRIYLMGKFQPKRDPG